MQSRQRIRHGATFEERLAARRLAITKMIPKEYPLCNMAKYLTKAAEFEQLAGATQDPVLQARFSNIAGCYRLLAREREWLIEASALEN